MKRFEHLLTPEGAAEAMRQNGAGKEVMDEKDFDEQRLTEHDLATDPQLRGINTHELLGRVASNVGKVNDARGLYDDTDRIIAAGLINNAKGAKGLY
jgi:hypothetical protein